MEYQAKLFVVFTEPEVSVVGFAKEEASAAGIHSAMGTYPFADREKPVAMEIHGSEKLIIKAAIREICGGTVVGPHASDFIHEMVVAIAYRLTPAQPAVIPHYNPTWSEIRTYPAEELAERWGSVTEGSLSKGAA